MENVKVYLGDSVYANFDGFNIILSLNNGDGDYNSIFLEPEVINALLKFKERIDNERRNYFSNNS